MGAASDSSQTPSKGIMRVYLQKTHSPQAHAGSGQKTPDISIYLFISIYIYIYIGPSTHQHQSCPQLGPCQRDQESGSVKGAGPSPCQIS